MATDPSELTGLAGWVVHTMEALGPVGVGALVALETVFPPIPSEVVLPVAGFLAGQGRMGLGWALLCATVGSVVGATVLYLLARRLGSARLGRVLDRLPLLDHTDLERADGWFGRHGSTAVLTGRLVPGVRSVVSVPAGLARMAGLRFVVLTALGSTAFNSILMVAGYVLGDRWTAVGEYSDVLNWAVGASLAVAVAVFVTRRLRRRTAADERTEEVVR